MGKPHGCKRHRYTVRNRTATCTIAGVFFSGASIIVTQPVGSLGQGGDKERDRLWHDKMYTPCDRIRILPARTFLAVGSGGQQPRPKTAHSPLAHPGTPRPAPPRGGRIRQCINAAGRLDPVQRPGCPSLGQQWCYYYSEGERKGNSKPRAINARGGVTGNRTRVPFARQAAQHRVVAARARGAGGARGGGRAMPAGWRERRRRRRGDRLET